MGGMFVWVLYVCACGGEAGEGRGARRLEEELGMQIIKSSVLSQPHQISIDANPRFLFSPHTSFSPPTLPLLPRTYSPWAALSPSSTSTAAPSWT